MKLFNKNIDFHWLLHHLLWWRQVCTYIYTKIILRMLFAACSNYDFLISNKQNCSLQNLFEITQFNSWIARWVRHSKNDGGWYMPRFSIPEGMFNGFQRDSPFVSIASEIFFSFMDTLRGNVYFFSFVYLANRLEIWYILFG